ncbi:DUF7835 family putative zinc beta-ribbon protein [Halegenticoccus soli]
MTQRDRDTNEVLRECEQCNKETVHNVSLRLDSTADESEVLSENTKYAKAPSREVTCTVCGTVTHEGRFQHEE